MQRDFHLVMTVDLWDATGQLGCVKRWWRVTWFIELEYANGEPFRGHLLQTFFDLLCLKEVGVKMRDTFLSLLAAGLSSQLCVVGVAGQPAAVGQGQVLTFRVAGSSVSDANGANVGNIEALSIDPQSGQVMFALVSQGFPNNRTTVTPIPWPLIQHRSDARQAGGIPGTFQQFTVPFSQQTLRSAPQIDSQAMARAADSLWMATSSSYFAPLVAAGGINATIGTQTGAGNSVANPNVPGFVPATNTFFTPTNTAPGFTNRPLQQGTTNAVLPGTFQAGAVDPTVPAGALPDGTLPAGALPPGTLPAGALPPGTVPNEGTALPPVDPVPRKAPLVPAAPAGPAK